MWFSLLSAPPQTYLILAFQLHKFHYFGYFRNFKSCICVSVFYLTNFQHLVTLFLSWGCYYFLPCNPLWLWIPLSGMTLPLHFTPVGQVACQFHPVLHPQSLLPWFFSGLILKVEHSERFVLFETSRRMTWPSSVLGLYSWPSNECGC